MTHQVFMISARLARDSMLPQDSTSTGSPSPRKLSVDSMVIHVLILETTANITADNTLGIRCRHITYRKLPPVHLAYSTYSLLRICRTSLRTILAMPNQPVTPMTKDRVNTFLLGNSAERISTSKIDGMLPPASTRRIITASARSGRTPLTQPYTVPITAMMAAPRSPIVRDVRPP